MGVVKLRFILVVRGEISICVQLPINFGKDAYTLLILRGLNFYRPYSFMIVNMH